jgi:hypothetical protein
VDLRAGGLVLCDLPLLCEWVLANLGWQPQSTTYKVYAQRGDYAALASRDQRETRVNAEVARMLGPVPGSFGADPGDAHRIFIDERWWRWEGAR